MARFDDAQRARWLRPNARIYVRPGGRCFMQPDACRFLRPDWKRFVQPGFAPVFLSQLEGKANFNPNQPRVPKGNPNGGQWTYEEGWRNGANRPFSAGRRPRIGHNQGPPLDEPPKVPENKPATKKEQNGFVKGLARWIDTAKQSKKNPVAKYLLLIEAVSWFDEFQHASIISYQDPPAELNELQEAAQGEPKLGYERHHIRMQKPARDDGFPDSMIDSPENVVLIPYWKHRDITGWFNQKNKDPKYNGLSPTEYLQGKTWDERREVGLEALRIHGVLKP